MFVGNMVSALSLKLNKDKHQKTQDFVSDGTVFSLIVVLLNRNEEMAVYYAGIQDVVFNLFFFICQLNFIKFEK